MYMVKETETAPLTEALGQLMHILRMLEKRQDLLLVGRMKVSRLCRLEVRLLAKQLYPGKVEVSLLCRLVLHCVVKPQVCSNSLILIQCNFQCVLS